MERNHLGHAVLKIREEKVLTDLTSKGITVLKKINSIGYSGKVIDIGTVLLAVIPLMLKAASYITGRLVFPLLGKISFCCDAVVLITEHLKVADQMRWVGLMNTVKAEVGEIIFAELIYS